MQTSDDVTVSAYPIPESLRVDPGTAIRQTVDEASEAEPAPAPAPAAPADKDIIIKRDRPGQPSKPAKAPKPSGEGAFELPPEQQVD